MSLRRPHRALTTRERLADAQRLAAARTADVEHLRGRLAQLTARLAEHRDYLAARQLRADYAAWLADRHEADHDAHLHRKAPR